MTTVRAEIRRGTDADGNPIELRVDPVALAALAASKEAGGGTATVDANGGALPDIDEIPLRIVVIEARLELVERELGRRRSFGSDP